MPRNNLQVEVNEVTDKDKRKITITIIAPAEDFLLGDLLAQRKAISPCAAGLKDAAIGGIKSWLESAEQVVAGTRIEQNTGNDGPPKRERKVKAPSAPDDVANRRVKPEPGTGTIAQTASPGS
jgi:hypothetical protein